MKNREQGAALVVSMISLFLVTLMGILSVRTSGIDLTVTSNSKIAAQTLSQARGELNSFLLTLNPNMDLNISQDVTVFGDVQVTSLGFIGCPSSVKGEEVGNPVTDSNAAGGGCAAFEVSAFASVAGKGRAVAEVGIYQVP